MTADDNPRLLQIVEAIADGSEVDWAPGPDGVAAGAPDSLQELRVIAALAAAHRQWLERPPAGSLGELLSASPPKSDRSQGIPWGPLLILDEVGGGSFGTVYRAWDPSLDRDVALKRIRLPAHTPPSKIASIVREGQLLARVRHENVIAVHGACEIDGEVGIWMDFVRGKTLEQLVRDGGPMSAQEASVIGESLCRALAAVHHAELLHRDVKAANVMREAGGRIVMLDFGSGTEVNLENPQGVRRVAGTPLYMAPELFEGGSASVQSDIYSLGVLLFYLTAETYPVQGDSLAEISSAHRAGRRRMLSDVRPDLPRTFTTVVARALAPRPDNRYESAGTMLFDLTGTPGPAPVQSHSVSWIAGGVLGIVLLPLLAGIFTTIQFNIALGRIGGFADDRLTMYWIHGFNALFAPLVYMLAAALTVHFAAAGFRQSAPLVVGFLPARWVARARNMFLPIRSRWRSVHPATLVDVLILAQLITLVALCWTFADVLIATSTKLSESSPDIFKPLQPSSLVRHAYRITLSVTVLAMAAAWSAVIRQPRTALNRSAVAAGIALIGIVFVLLVLPYRMTWKNDFERVDFGGLRCYITGTTGENILVYCPEAPVSKVRVLPRNDAALTRLDTIESIFSIK